MGTAGRRRRSVQHGERLRAGTQDTVRGKTRQPSRCGVPRGDWARDSRASMVTPRQHYGSLVWVHTNAALTLLRLVCSGCQPRSRQTARAPSSWPSSLGAARSPAPLVGYVCIVRQTASPATPALQKSVGKPRALMLAHCACRRYWHQSTRVTSTGRVAPRLVAVGALEVFKTTIRRIRSRCLEELGVSVHTRTAVYMYSE